MRSQDKSQKRINFFSNWFKNRSLLPYSVWMKEMKFNLKKYHLIFLKAEFSLFDLHEEKFFQKFKLYAKKIQLIILSFCLCEFLAWTSANIMRRDYDRLSFLKMQTTLLHYYHYAWDPFEYSLMPNCSPVLPPPTKSCS